MLGLASRTAFLGGFDPVVDGIAQDVDQRRFDDLEHLLVEAGVLALQLDVDELAVLLRQVAHRAREPCKKRGHRQHADLGNLAVQCLEQHLVRQQIPVELDAELPERGAKILHLRRQIVRQGDQRIDVPGGDAVARRQQPVAQCHGMVAGRFALAHEGGALPHLALALGVANHRFTHQVQGGVELAQVGADGEGATRRLPRRRGLALGRVLGRPRRGERVPDPRLGAWLGADIGLGGRRNARTHARTRRRTSREPRRGLGLGGPRIRRRRLDARRLRRCRHQSCLVRRCARGPGVGRLQPRHQAQERPREARHLVAGGEGLDHRLHAIERLEQPCEQHCVGAEPAVGQRRQRVLQPVRHLCHRLQTQQLGRALERVHVAPHLGRDLAILRLLFQIDEQRIEGFEPLERLLPERRKDRVIPALHRPHPCLALLPMPT
jgi:hypothetical protein